MKIFTNEALYHNYNIAFAIYPLVYFLRLTKPLPRSGCRSKFLLKKRDLGTGGRIRDIHSTGRGAHEIAAVAGYSCGNLHLPEYSMPWEEEKEIYPNSLSHPRQVPKF